METPTTDTVKSTITIPVYPTSKPIYFEDYDYFGDFITSSYVKSYWTAFYILCLYWGCLWFCRHIFGDGHNNMMLNREEAVHNLEHDRTRRTNQQHLLWTNSATAVNIYTRLNRACSFVRDLIILLMAALVLNTMARGGTRSVMILSWIYLGTAILASIYELLYSHYITRLVYSIAFYGIMVTIGAIAFKIGFDQYD